MNSDEERVGAEDITDIQLIMEANHYIYIGEWSGVFLLEDFYHNLLPQRTNSCTFSPVEPYLSSDTPASISNTVEKGPVKNLIAQALVSRILMAAKDGTKFKVVILIPEVPGFSGNIKDETAIKTIMAAQVSCLSSQISGDKLMMYDKYRTMNRGGNSIYEAVRNAGYEP